MDGQSFAIIVERLCIVAHRKENAAAAVVGYRQITLAHRVVRGAVGKLLPDCEHFLIRRQRVCAFALGFEGATDPVVADRLFAEPIGIVGIRGPTGCPRICCACWAVTRARGGIAYGKEGVGAFIQCHALAALQDWRGLARFAEVLLQGERPVENVLDESDRHARSVAELHRQMENESVGGLRCRIQSLFGAIALCDGLATLHCRLVGQPSGEPDENQQAASRRPGQCQRATLLSDLLGKQILLWHAADGGSEVGASLQKSVVARGGALAIRPQVHPLRLRRKFAGQYRR